MKERLKVIRKFTDPGAALRTCARYNNSILISGKEGRDYYWVVGRIYQDNHGHYYAALQIKGGFKALTVEEMKGSK